MNAIAENSSAAHASPEEEMGFSNTSETTLIIQEPNHWFWLLITLTPFGIQGNLMVIIAVFKYDKLRKYLNKELASMAVADLLVCLIVIPLGASQLVYGYWRLKSDIICLIYLYSDITLCTSSILHMCCVSLDRYRAVAFPLNIHKRNAAQKIFIVWCLSILIGLPTIIHYLVNPSSIYTPNGQCGFANQAFQIYGSLLAFYIPMIIMAILYILTIHKLNEKTSKGQLLVRSRGCSQRSLKKTNSSQQMSRNSSKSENSTDADKDSRNVLRRVRSNLLRQKSRKKSDEVTNEYKAAKTLGFAFALFVISWAPFFIINLRSGCCPTCKISSKVLDFTLWLAYSASAVNPIVYTIVNKDFQKAFRDILTCKIWVKESYTLRSAIRVHLAPLLPSMPPQEDV